MDERALLQRLIAGPASGDALARVSGQTRAAVWKRIEALREAGVAIEAKPGRGYALSQPLGLLDAAAIVAALPAQARARLAELEVAWSIDSTNSELLRRATPAQGATVLLAERQTGGRGRRGREWASPLAAHLYLSLSRSFGGGLARLGGLSLVAGIAAVEALHGLGYEGVRLKWPNDLVVLDARGLRKLGGLLIEGGGEHAGPARAVIGLGLNVRMPAAAAAAIDQPWCDLATLGDAAAPARDAVAAALLARLLPALDEFDADGLAPFLPRYAALDALAGAAIAVHGGNGLRQDGIALGLAEDGALRVRLGDGSLQNFHAGEVSVRRAPGAKA
ncbi:bifunctional biotin--[acetyl-CoA-carboxylase] ligase/biotin operon repressor BirA [Lysobacter sp. cf310]|uniref:bifunctional biotin--[acetyl-CoA-carboxylase] ligase/biotin operon repressor BirA n=1 Tax=Lysobacter sp. cf310 TaxID=1761790 RepID=UPI0008EAC629|nr:bifunctional biotin--[acetyl-CoA-carboxylase] ligase/biotin operon repressor BirA [Lysobacter sp. cf310]SFK47415.1 BirA family transcriptional regulator, biotin operon repressor / biotin-[acetyl-CoA-carboxylase] ligase [Lysobacter sp. cf310]